MLDHRLGAISWVDACFYTQELLVNSGMDPVEAVVYTQCKCVTYFPQLIIRVRDCSRWCVCDDIVFLFSVHQVLAC